MIRLNKICRGLFKNFKNTYFLAPRIQKRSFHRSSYRSVEWISNKSQIITVPSYEGVFDWQQLIEEASHEIEYMKGTGDVADYIPELATVDPSCFGAAMATVDGSVFSVGDAEKPFSIQSVSKVFTLLLAMTYVDDGLWKRVGREPSGNAFNSLVQLEYENGIPRNPFINAGAVVVTDVLQNHVNISCPLMRHSTTNEHFGGASDTVLNMLQYHSGNPLVCVNEEVLASEQSSGHRNYALAHFMASCGNISNHVDDVLYHYFRQCSIEMSCEDLARAGLILARQGKDSDGKQLISSQITKRVEAIMMTCGTYDAAGDIAYRIGLPCKSGVGGAILAIFPRVGALVVWSPGLDERGNSVAGVSFLDKLTTKSGFSVF